MDNLGKFLYMAVSALLFIFALTASLYLYLTLDNYIEFATGISNVYDRVEGEAYEPSSNKREIPWGEVFITITNMDQMHIDKVIVGTRTFKIGDSTTNIKSELNSLTGKTVASYSKSGDTIVYTLKDE